MNVGDGQGESGMSSGKDIRRSRTCPFGEEEDAARGVPGRPERGKRLWSQH